MVYFFLMGMHLKGKLSFGKNAQKFIFTVLLWEKMCQIFKSKENSFRSLSA